MEYIDKKINLAEGNSYSSDYLYDSFDEEDKCFKPSISSKQAYVGFSHKKYRYGDGLADGRRGLAPLLVDEQGGRCCYCMARIEPKHICIEHVIPESLDKLDAQEEFLFYTGCAAVLNDYVELAETFAKHQFASKADMRNLTRFPHLISYVNLTASCHGVIDKRNSTSCFCNNPRGNKRITPIMLVPDPLSHIEYDITGSIRHRDLKEDKIKNTIEALCLNHPRLQEIRILWYRISRCGKILNEILSITELADKISLMKKIFNTDDYTTLEEEWKKYAPIPPIENIDKHETYYWDLLMKYDWFYDYYLIKYPR